MAENKAFSNAASTHNNFKEAVCIDAGRIYDSCSDKDCLEDLMVVFAPDAQYVIDAATSVKVKCVEVLTVCLDVEPVPFNKGFYSVDMTFYFKIDLKVATPGACDPTCVSGVAKFAKKVILYGSEGNVKIFTSRNCCEHPFQHTTNMPKASVQTVAHKKLSEQFAVLTSHIFTFQSSCLHFDIPTFYRRHIYFLLHPSASFGGLYILLETTII